MIELTGEKFEPGTDVELTFHITEGVVVHALKGDKGTIFGKAPGQIQHIVNMWDGKRLVVRINQMKEI